MGFFQEQVTAKRIWKSLMVLLLIGVFVCMLVDYIINRAFTWSLYPAGASVLALGLAAALFFGGKHRLLLMVAVLAVLTMPFLLLVQHLSGTSAWVWPVGFPIAAVSLLALLLTVVLLRYTRISRWTCAGIAVLTTIPIDLTATHVASMFLNQSRGVFEIVSDVVSIIGIGAVAFFLFARGRRKKQS